MLAEPQTNCVQESAPRVPVASPPGFGRSRSCVHTQLATAHDVIMRSGLLVRLCHAYAMSCSLSGPIIPGSVLPGHRSKAQWSAVCLAASISVVATLKIKSNVTVKEDGSLDGTLEVGRAFPSLYRDG